MHESNRGAPGDPALPQPGEIIAGKYEVERVLGAGGMGVVLCAVHRQLGQRVAIKFMRAEWAQDESAVGRFLREARAAAALGSAHVTKVLDVGTLDDGAPYMVMEYLAGTDLADQVKRHGPMPVPEAVAVVLQACEALAEAHAIGIVHRDLKPSNLFLTRAVDGSLLVKVLDFGISKMTDPAMSGSGSLTSTGSIMGSPGYMSPEQIRSAKDVDRRSDIWALGIIFYEILTGAPPFRGDTFGEMFAKILTESPAPIRSVRPDLPEGLATAIQRCLERDLQQRTQSVADLATSLMPFATGVAVLSVDRILRTAGKAAGQVRQETMAAPSGTLAADGRDFASGRSERVETGAPWQRSGSAEMPAGVGRRRAIIGGAGAAVVACAAGLFAWGARSAGGAAPGLPASGAPTQPASEIPGAMPTGLAAPARPAEPSASAPAPFDAGSQAPSAAAATAATARESTPAVPLVSASPPVTARPAGARESGHAAAPAHPGGPSPAHPAAPAHSQGGPSFDDMLERRQ